MTTSPRVLPLLLLAACIPSMPASWSSSSPAPPPPAETALDRTEPAASPPQVAESTSHSSGSRTVSHKINGREMSGGGGGGGSSGASSRDSEFPQPSARQLQDLRRTLDDLPTGDRVKKFSSLIDPFYLTVDQLAELVEELPRFDRVKAIDFAACSVLDPENAGRITAVVSSSDKSKAISALQKQCYRKNSWDKRPPGKASHHAAPPPAAYLLPSER